MINETWRLAPWADALYACDERWWRLRGPSSDAFQGARLIGFGERSGCTPCGVVRGANEMRWDGRSLGAGGNSGFQAVNLAAAQGARRIVLTGFDMGGRGHWHGLHAGPELTNPDRRMLAGCAKLLDLACPGLEARGVEVVNASRVSALSAYRRVTMKEALA